MVVDIDDFGPGAQKRGPRPVLRLVGRSYPSSNDNAAADAADEVAESVLEAFGADRPSRPDRPAGLSRRRGPLITRWIGFAARRQRAQERTDRLAREQEAQRPRFFPTR